MEVSVVTHLLDTQAWIWFFSGDRRAEKLVLSLPPEATLGISVVSIWEAAMLEAKARVSFPLGLDDWLGTMRQHEACVEIPLSSEMALAGARLHTLHGDPADRLIVATAMCLGIPLITADRKIVEWARFEARLSVMAI